MNRFFTFLLAASCLTAVGQVTYPYNPDGNADGSIAVGDLQDFLVTYGNPFSPSEIMVGDTGLTQWIQLLSEELESQQAVIETLKSAAGIFNTRFPEGVGEVLSEKINVVPYIVPEGKHLYITYFNNGPLGSTSLPENEQFDPSSNNPNLPFVFGSGEGVRAHPNPAVVKFFQGFLVDAVSAVTPITDTIQNGGKFTVPSGKNLYLLHWQGGTPFIYTDEFSEDFTQYENQTELSSSKVDPLVITSGNALGTNVAGFSYFNGYLVDEDYFDTPLQDPSDEEPAEENLGPCQGEFTVNYHGYDYELVEIGDQCWFAENLKAKALRDGQIIHGAGEFGWPSSAQNEMRWAYPGGAIIPQVNGGEGFEFTLGLFYNGLVALEPVCPAGYHVPSVIEFNELIDLYGGQSEAGLYMKDSPPLGNGSNDSGFSGVLTGDLQGINYYNYPNRAVYWTSTINGTNDYGGFYIFTKDLSVQDNNVDEQYENSSGQGCSIRCIKDAE